MKKLNFVVAGVISAVVGLGISCSTSDIMKNISKPTADFNKISFVALDSEGLTLNCNYSVSNPYPVSLSLAKVVADVNCNDSAITKIDANEGISISARNSKANNFNFKITYDSILNLANTYKSNSSLPLTVKGNATVSNSLISSLTLPFSKSINIPVFKPSFSLSNPKLVLPSLSEVVESLVKSGMNALTAATTAKNFISGSAIESNILEKMNLNLKLNFDLDVKNEGGANWNYLIKSCSIKTEENSLINLDAVGSNSISSNGKVPLTATLNTVKFGKFIAQILSKKGTNPTFALDSGISFPEFDSVSLPLAYTKEIPLNSFSLK